MRALLDISVLLAALDTSHVEHTRARDWWGQHQRAGWASCPLTQNGFVRILSQPGYSNPQSLEDAVRLLAIATQQSEHEFWADDISIADTAVFDHARILGPRQITDAYLLALAVKNGGRLVTFDRGVPHDAVRGACAEHLVVL